MSHTLRCLRASFHHFQPSLADPGLPLKAAGARRYAQLAMKARAENDPRPAPQRVSQRGRPRVGYVDEDRDFHSSTSRAGTLEQNREVIYDGENGAQEQAFRLKWKGTPEPHFAEHLNALFPTLSFPPELARRILTHASHPASVYGHNAALSFTGRRVLESYLLLMITSSSALKPTHDLDAIVARTLNSYVLGESIGSPWGLGRALRWTPTVPAAKLRSDQDQRNLLRSVGLYKVQGETVGAIIGGIFFQFGASTAHRVFHTRVLPNLLDRKTDGLPEAFHDDARVMCERMGGASGKLLLDTPTTPPEASTI